jgi:hypothetical protein
MAVRKISEEQFHKYNVLKSPMANSLGTEESWYEEKDNNLIATIINDRYDKDWSFVILAKNENNEFTAIDLGISIKEQNDAERQVVIKLNELSKTGEFREELYSEDKKAEKTEQRIIITDINEEVKKYLKKHPEKLYELTSRKFEELVASILEDMGLTVQPRLRIRENKRILKFFGIVPKSRKPVTSFLGECYF